MSESGLPRIRRAAPTAAPPAGDAGVAHRATASAFSQIAAAAQQIQRDIIDPRIIQHQVELAREEVAAGVATARSGSNEFDRAYNNAAGALIVSRSIGDTESAINELLAEFPDDPDAFEEAAEKKIESSVGEHDPIFAQALEVDMRRRFASAQRSIAIRIRENTIKEADEAMALHSANASRTMLSLAQSLGQEAVATPEFQAALDEWDKTTQIRMNNPLIVYSEERAAADRLDLFKRVEEAILIPEIDRAHKQGGLPLALELAGNLADDPDRERSLDERRALRQSLTERANFLDRKQDAAFAAFRREEVLTDRAVKRSSDAALKEIQTLAFSGELTADAVAERLSNLRTEDFTKAMTLLNADDQTPDDDGFALELQRRKRRGENVDGEVFDALTSGRISLSTAQRIDDLDNVDTRRLRPGYELIEAGFAQSGFLTDPLIEAKEAEAQVAIEEWLDENPEATRAEIRDEARDIVRRFGGAVFENAELPSLRFGSRPANSKELDRFKSLLDEDFENGAITELDYYEQMELYDRWRGVIAMKEFE